MSKIERITEKWLQAILQSNPVPVQSNEVLENLCRASRYNVLEDTILRKCSSDKNVYSNFFNFALFSPKEGLTRREACQAMKEEGYNPAKLNEIVVFGAMYPRSHGKILAFDAVFTDSYDEKIVCINYEPADYYKKRNAKPARRSLVLLDSVEFQDMDGDDDYAEILFDQKYTFLGIPA